MLDRRDGGEGFHYYEHLSNFRRNFQVTAPLEPDHRVFEVDQRQVPTSLTAQIELQLAEKTQAADTRARTVLQPPPEQSAWLQTTEWVRYLQGHNLEAAAWLAALSDLVHKPILPSSELHHTLFPLQNFMLKTSITSETRSDQQCLPQPSLF